MAVSRVPHLVSTEWLKPLISRSTLNNVKVLDSTWSPKKDAYQKFLEGRIPHSQHYDLDEGAEPLPMIPRNLPSEKCFSDYASSLGLNNDSHLVIYDRGSMMWSSRLWWMFRVFGHNQVSVLDGGYNRWVASLYPITQGEENLKTHKKGNFEAKKNRSLLTEYEALVEAVKQKDVQIVDARNKANFNGEQPEPTPATIGALESMKQSIPTTMHRGHILGAFNVPDEDLVDSHTNCFNSPDKLKAVFQAKGVDVSKDIITMCYSGNLACKLALAAALCDNPNASVYYPSWTEWGQRAPHDLCSRPPAQAG